MLEQDLFRHEEWKKKAEVILNQLEDDEMAIQKDLELRVQFDELKEQMRQLPIYDKDIFIRMQVFEWLF